MNAAQACSNQRYTWHHAPEESKAAADAGYPYGFGDNLTVFTGTYLHIVCQASAVPAGGGFRHSWSSGTDRQREQLQGKYPGGRRP